MWQDPIVEEVRQEREAYFAQFDYNLHALCADLRRQEQEGEQPVVIRPPRLCRKDACRAQQQAQGVGE